DDRQIYLVGTAHVSKESVEDVRNTVALVDPDTICVELCESRHKTLTQKDIWSKMNIFAVIKEKKAVLLLAQLTMSSFYRRLGEKLGVQPGAEMLEGVALADDNDRKLVLADRDIQITLKRVWGYLGFWTKMKLLNHLLISIFSREEIDLETVETLKQQDQLESIMAEFAEQFPEIKRRLIDERDIYLAQKLRSAPGKRVVAVVGAGHCQGIEEHIQQDESLDNLVTIPPKSIIPKIIGWSIPILILLLFGYGFHKHGLDFLIENIWIWFLGNGIPSAIGAAVALAHPLTILSAFLFAPLTSLNPLIAAGWVAGLVQALVKRPTVNDFEDMPNAIYSVKGFWMNPVTRILLVVMFANLGSVLGTWVSGVWIAARSVN
ncbi:MAG: TraB/GumN family protein, partial [Planctomycetes bacterium]|nr:TraB/GumN family protein [Planctomycetota bacterium]